MDVSHSQKLNAAVALQAAQAAEILDAFLVGLNEGLEGVPEQGDVAVKIGAPCPSHANIRLTMPICAWQELIEALVFALGAVRTLEKLSTLAARAVRGPQETIQ